LVGRVRGESYQAVPPVPEARLLRLGGATCVHGANDTEATTAR